MRDRKKLAVGVGAGVLFFVCLALWVRAGGTQSLDMAIREWVNGWAFPALTRVMQAITTLGSGWVLWPVGGLVVLRLATTDRRHHALWFAAVVLISNLVSQLLKLEFHRQRPTVFFGLRPAESYSFPSGHSFVAALFYAMLAAIALEAELPRAKRRFLAGLTLLTGFLIGLSRVYLGYHYPSDVLGGWTLAVVAFLLAEATHPVQK